MDNWGGADFDVLVDGSSGSMPMPTYQSYGSSRHVPNSTIDIVQYTGTGPATVTYTVVATLVEYNKLIGYYRTIPRAYHTLVIYPDDLGYWHLESVSDPQKMIDGRVMFTITLREHD
jgi:hypothetical protein